MKKNFARKLFAVLAAVTCMTAVTGCNRQLKVTYDCNSADYIKLGQYKGIEVTVDESTIVDKIVTQRVQSDLDSYTEYKEVSREAADEDQVTIQFTGTIGGQTVEGFSSDEYSLILGKDTFAIQGFVDALYGMKAGDTKVVTLQVPDSFPDAVEYQGKRIVYNITMSKVEVPVAPQVTDAYVKNNFSYDTVEQYKEAIKSELAEDIAEQVYDAKYEAVMVKLQENTEVLGYPEAVLNSKKEELEKSITFYSGMYNMSSDEYCQSRYGMKFEDFAKKTVAQQLIIQQIVAEEKLTIDEYYYKGNLAEFASNQGFTSAETFVEKYGKDLIVKQMLNQKAIDMVMDNAVVIHK